MEAGLEHLLEKKEISKIERFAIIRLAADHLIENKGNEKINYVIKIKYAEAVSQIFPALEEVNFLIILIMYLKNCINYVRAFSMF